MNFKPALWYPIAVVLSVINVAGLGFAIGQAEPAHAGIHGALALVFGVWAQRLRQGRGGSDELAARLDALEELEADVRKLQQQLTETQERLDFVERLLAQERDTRRVGPQR